MKPANKRRSRRLQKKLRLGEFQEWGFTYRAKVATDLTSDAEDRLINRFLDEVIEPRSLALGGWVTVGFIAAFDRKVVTEEDRVAVEAWFRAQPEYKEVQVSPLIDAWYADIPENEP